MKTLIRLCEFESLMEAYVERYIGMAKLYANSGSLDQMPHFAASDQVNHCLQIV